MFLTSWCRQVILRSFFFFCIIKGSSGHVKVKNMRFNIQILIFGVRKTIIRLPPMTGLTLWSLGCVAKSWADQNVNEGRINTLEASEISTFLQEFWAFSHLQLLHSGLNQVTSWRLAVFPPLVWFQMLTNRPTNQNPPTKSLVFSSGLRHIGRYRAAQSVLIIWTKISSKDNPEKWRLVSSVLVHQSSTFVT